MKKGIMALFGALALILPSIMATTAAAGDDLGNAANNYQLYCSMCHGRDGDGKGQLAETMDVPPRNHTDTAYMSKRTDDQLFKTIRDGGDATGFSAAMPSHNTILHDEDIRGLVKYLRQLCNCKYSG